MASKKTVKKQVSTSSKKTSPKGAQAPAEKARMTSRPSVLSRPEVVVCREMACESLPTSAGYCRLHYIKNWRQIKSREILLAEGKLNRFLEELVAKYPNKYLEAIRQDLSNFQEFSKVARDLELEESSDEFDAESDPIGAMIGNIRRDLDEDAGGA